MYVVSQKFYNSLLSRNITGRYAPLKQGNQLRKREAWDP